jgi:hypothetical protein
MKSIIFLLAITLSAEARYLRPNYIMSQQRRYEVVPDKNFDVVERHAMKFSDLENGIVREPESSTEEKELER